ncbi:hypothetical protein GNP80_05295 [Aliivibrio fischeri]|uniref:toxic anion resistance protein n=1 Tax=Aliivibrio fischeri TaxID=668 RepID=UPI0012D976E4|nr:toxic anion resistance protein [Aliivibrio fischeri]MUK91852.1 hypothetical protein [Aliivibrio fischeri]
MIKTFHTKNVPNQLSANTESQPKVQLFTHIKPSNRKSSQPEIHTPTVLFTNKVRAIQTDILPIDEQLKMAASMVCTQIFPELKLRNNDYLELGNMKAEIKFYEAYYQIEFGNTYSKKFQDIQGFLSDYAKVGKVDSILDFGKELIQIARSININIFNPNKIGTKLSSFLGNRQSKVNRIKCEFDGVSDHIDAKLNSVYENLSDTYDTLESFNYWSKEMTELHQKLRLSIIALTLRVEEEKLLNSDDNSAPLAFQSGNADIIQRWERKINMLLALNQSVTMTFPQMNLYTSNLVTSFERLEEIKVNIIQVWKHQFLGVIAADESSDARMFSELSHIQEQLIKNIEELK